MSRKAASTPNPERESEQSSSIESMVTPVEHRFQFGETELAIPAGTEVDNLLFDAGALLGTAGEIIFDSAMQCRGAEDRIWAACNLVTISKAMVDAAHRGVPRR